MDSEFSEKKNETNQGASTNTSPRFMGWERMNMVDIQAKMNWGNPMKFFDTNDCLEMNVYLGIQRGKHHQACGMTLSRRVYQNFEESARLE